MVQLRKVLAVLIRSRPIDLARSFGIPGLTDKSKDQIVQGMAAGGGSTGLPLQEVANPD